MPRWCGGLARIGRQGWVLVVTVLIVVIMFVSPARLNALANVLVGLTGLAAVWLSRAGNAERSSA